MSTKQTKTRGKLMALQIPREMVSSVIPREEFGRMIFQKTISPCHTCKQCFANEFSSKFLDLLQLQLPAHMCYRFEVQV